MEKAIEIKRRAQRCVQNGDLDGALREYEKLVETPESDPYNFVLLADLLFKKGEHQRAAERYLNAVSAYEKAGLYKNAIAVCKKMTRLSLSQTQVLRHLADLHKLDGLVSEASLCYAQYAEQMLRSNNVNEAIAALRKAFDCGQENVKLLEQMADAMLSEGQTARAAEVLREAAGHWRTRRQESDARRCLDRANVVDPGSARAPSAAAGTPRPATASGSFASPGEIELSPGRGSSAGTLEAPPAAATPAPATTRGSSGFERAPQFVAPGGAIGPPVLWSPTRPQGPPVLEHPAGEEPSAPAEGVYEIGSEEHASYEGALAEVQSPAAQSPPEDPYAEQDRENLPSPSMIARRPPAIAGAALVETLLARAQEDFRAGRRAEASQALVEAAQAYEGLGRLDSAATIFRSLGRGAQSPTQVMELWLANCEKRGDRAEGSQVACELGDRALNDGKDARARAWFEHAAALDPANDTARRRLQRMTQGGRPAAPAPAPATTGAGEAGRVEVAVGRGQAVTFDLEGLLQEFQRGVDTQLDGDAQGHYDLGMAYREMGLHEQAVQSFQIALKDPRFAGLAHEMIGRCHADTGHHESAVADFAESLRLPDLDAAGEAELRYRSALSMAAMGDLAAAVAQLEIADMRFPGRPDVVKQLAEWRRGFRQAA